MGLDIGAYKNLVPLDDPIRYGDDGYPIRADDKDCFANEVAEAFDDYHVKSFGIRPGYFDGLRNDIYYGFEACDCFYGSAYSTYSMFRNVLEDYALSVGDMALFREMVHFSDCDGTIGPVVCQKLYEDFKGAEKAFKKWMENDAEEDDDFGAWMIALYDAYLESLAFATNNGTHGHGCLVYM